MSGDLVDVFTDDEWEDLVPSKAQGKLLPDVTIRLSKGKLGRRAKTTIALRRRAAELVLAAGPRFRVQIGGPQANKIRIVKDHLHGRYECGEYKGIALFRLGFVSTWPDENRDMTEALWSGDPSSPTGLVLVLPATFAKPTIVEPPKPALVAGGRVIDRRPTGGSYNFGDPPPGRSALDKQRAAGK